MYLEYSNDIDGECRDESNKILLLPTLRGIFSSTWKKKKKSGNW